MVRLRIIRTQTLEFDADPTDYPDGSSPETMLAIDLANANDDPELMFDQRLMKGGMIEELSGAVVEE